MKMVLIDVIERKIKLVDASTLDDYYNYIRCSCVDIITRKIGKLQLPIICDDDALLKQNAIPSAFTK